MITKFTDLIAWQEAHKLVLQTYKILENFPKKETFALCDQIRRCVVSISANIAEGFSRRGKKEKMQFYYISKGSLTELENHFLIAKDVNYITETEFDNLLNQMDTVGRLLTGLIRAVS
jgi:four helix bundle protein